LTRENKENTALTKFLWAATALFVIALAGLIYYTSTTYAMSKFRSTDSESRRWGVNRLVSIGEGAGKPMFRLATDKNAETELRRLSIYVLGEIKYAPAESTLAAMLKEGPVILRAQSAYALGRFGDRKYLPDLMDAYRTGPRGVKLKSITALGEIGGAEAVDLLKTAEKSDDDLVSMTARYALEKAEAAR